MKKGNTTRDGQTRKRCSTLSKLGRQDSYDAEGCTHWLPHSWMKAALYVPTLLLKDAHYEKDSKNKGSKVKGEFGVTAKMPGTSTMRDIEIRTNQWEAGGSRLGADLECQVVGTRGWGRDNPLKPDFDPTTVYEPRSFIASVLTDAEMKANFPRAHAANAMNSFNGLGAKGITPSFDMGHRCMEPGVRAKEASLVVELAG